MKTFFFAGNGSYSNRGCEAIVRSTVEILTSEFGDSRFLSGYFPDPGCNDIENETDPLIKHLPLQGYKKYSSNWVLYKLLEKLSFNRASSFYYKAWRKSIEESDVVLMLGGDNYSLDYAKPYKFFEINQYALSLNKPIVLWGSSVGPFSKDRKFEEWAANQLRKVTLILVRETQSLEYLKTIGVDKNVKLVADPAFCLKPEKIDIPDSLSSAISAGAIGINLSPLMSRYYSNNFDTWIKCAIEIVKSILSNCNRNILLIPHVTSDNGVMGKRDDYLFLEKIHSILAGDNRVHLLTNTYNAGQTKWIIGQLDAFIGARTHSTIASLSSFVPTIAIGYSIKARGIITDIFSNDKWLLDIRGFTPDIIVEKITSAINENQSIKALLKNRIPVIQNRAYSAAEYIKAYLE